VGSATPIDWESYRWTPDDGRSNRVNVASVRDVTGAAGCGMSLFAGIDDGERRLARRLLFGADGAVVQSDDVAELSSPTPFSDCQRFVAIANMGTSEQTGYYAYELVQRRVGDDRSTQLTHMGSYLSSPSLAASDTSVVFLSNPGRSGPFHLFMMDLREGQPRRIEVAQ
jgi:hypothetical protein